MRPARSIRVEPRRTAPWVKVLAEDIAAVVTLAPQADVVEALLSLAGAYARVSRGEDMTEAQAEAALVECGVDAWERAHNLAPFQLTATSVPLPGDLSVRGADLAERIDQACRARLGLWQQALSPWGGIGSTGFSAGYVLFAARAAQPGPLSFVAWRELVRAAFRDESFTALEAA